MYRFFGKRILGREDGLAERAFQVEKDEDLLALHNRALPPHAVTYEGLYQQWRTAPLKRETIKPHSINEDLQ
jgi:hypothetical protein